MAFNAKCERFVGGVAIIDATIQPADEGPPPCEDTRSNCRAGIEAGFTSCDLDFCSDCGEPFACPFPCQFTASSPTGMMCMIGRLTCAGRRAHTCDVTCDFCGAVSTTAPLADEPLLLCFDLVCPTPILTEYSSQGKGVVTEIGTCAPGGALDSICRLGCAEGYEASHISEGRCLPRWFAHDEVAVAEYTGQNVTCTPEMNQDGSMAESWCRMERDEALRSCCASAGSSEPACGPDAPPLTCELACAEVWLPLSRSCEQYYAADALLTVSP